jgi:hypothetical protein
MTVRRGVTLTVFRSFEDADRAQQGWWSRTMSAGERVIFAWTLSRDLWGMLGRRRDESGLSRSVASVHRR